MSLTVTQVINSYLLSIEDCHSMKRTRMAEANCFLGLDNPRQHEQDSTLLSSIRFFIKLVSSTG